MNKRLFGNTLFLSLLATSSLAMATDARQATFGTMPDGQKVEVVTLDDGHGFTARVISLGAALHISVEGENTHHMVEGCFKATGRALRQAKTRHGTELPSTKGTL